MRTTGIVRRIDELGRVVIPKEIRRTMRIKEGEELEVIVNSDDTLLLKKYSAVKDYSTLAKEYVEVLGAHTGYTCLICDMDTIVACSREKSTYQDKNISKNLENNLLSRKSSFFRSKDAFSIIVGGEKLDNIIVPIVLNGDCVGGIILVSNVAISKAEICQKTLELGAKFFAMQIE